MTNEHIINPAHSIMTLFIALSVISYILQVGYAKPLHCIHNIICDSPNEYCDPVGEDCVSCSRVCPQGTEYCQRLCPDYYHIHFNISTTQEPAIEEVTSAVPHHNAKVPRNAEENTTLPPESNNTVLTVVLSIVGSLLVIIVLVVGILVFLCKRHQQSPTNHEDGEGVSRHNRLSHEKKKKKKKKELSLCMYMYSLTFGKTDLSLPLSPLLSPPQKKPPTKKPTKKHKKQTNLEALRECRTPWPWIITNEKMLCLGGERRTPKVLDHYLYHDLVMLQLLL